MIDLQHQLFVMTVGLYQAPLKNPQRVLDIATGTGIWAIEFAEENPSAVVLGTDLRYADYRCLPFPSSLFPSRQNSKTHFQERRVRL